MIVVLSWLMSQKTFNYFTWTILLTSVLLPLFVWGEYVNWKIFDVNVYQLFPLFGLLAWMIMCTHYFTGAIRIKSTGLKKPRFYAGITGYLVLLFILLHPGLLAYAQYDNGQGLPPQSFVDYYGQGLLIAGILGTISLMIFLSFEVFKRIRDRPTIKKNWILVSLSQSLAMIMIFVHGLHLGSNLDSGWFMYVWILYGLALIPCFYLIHKFDFEQLKEQP